MKTEQNMIKMKFLDFSLEIILNNEAKMKNSTNVNICAAINSDLNIVFEIGLKIKSVISSNER